MLTLKALGSLDLRDADGRPLSAILAQPKRAALLLYLASSHPPELHRRDALLALFWPELDQEHGRQALSQALSFLRKEAGAAVVVGRGHDEVGVDATQMRCDVVAFKEALERRDWEGALDLYRGELLDGLHVAEASPFVDWVDRERTRLREAAASAAWAAAHQLIAGGRLVESERMAQRALALVATDESPVRSFIQALADAGDRGAALRFYEKFRALLGAELEVDPAPETEAVASALRRRTARAPATGASAAPARAPVRALRDEPVGEGALTGQGGPPPDLEASAATGAEARVPFLAGATLVLAVVAGLAVLWARWSSQALAVTNIVPVTHEPGVEFLPAVSPDGSSVAYVSGGPLDGGRGPRALEVRPATGGVGGRVQLTDPAAVTPWESTWTADGETVRFWGCTAEGGCSWMEVGRMGGAPSTAKLPPGRAARVRQLAWSADGNQVAYFVRDTLFVEPMSGGERVLLVVDPADRVFGARHSPAWSPGGTRIAFVNGSRPWWDSFDSDPSSVWVVDVATGEAREVEGGGATCNSPVWVDDAHLLFVSTRDGPPGVYLAEVGPQGLVGEPALVGGMPDVHTLSYSRPTALVAFARFAREMSIRAYPIEPPEPVSIADGELVIGGNLTVLQHDISPDGRWIVFEANHLGNADLYKMPLAGGDPVRLTDSPEDEVGPRWSPDGREIVFNGGTSAPAAAEWDVFVLPAGGGTPQQVTRSPSRQAMSYWPTWSEDGLSLAVTSRHDGYVGWTVSRDSGGGAWREPSPVTSYDMVWPVWRGDTILVNPNARGDSLLALSRRGEVLWARAFADTSPLRVWGWAMQMWVSRSRGTLYSRGIHKDGTEGIYAVGDWGRGEPRLVVAYDDPSLQAFYMSVGPDRIYLTVQRDESDIWVARLKR
jgi:Tol biopolymer transport system component/DNA-binding SARP family transcriptional activator